MKIAGNTRSIFLRTEFQLIHVAQEQLLIKILTMSFTKIEELIRKTSHITPRTILTIIGKNRPTTLTSDCIPLHRNHIIFEQEQITRSGDIYSKIIGKQCNHFFKRDIV